LKYFLYFRICEQLALALKNRVCPELIHCSEYLLFIIQSFEQFAFALKNRVCPKIFPVLNYFLSFRIFEQVVLALKTEFALNFSSRVGGRPPDPPPRTPLLGELNYY